VPEDVTVHYRDASGLGHRADVTTNTELPKGAQVPIRYTLDAPGWARIDGAGDSLDLGAGLGAAGTLAVLGFTGVRLLRMRAGRRAVSDAVAAPARPGLALLTADPAGDPLMLVCDPVSTPVTIIAVPIERPLPGGTARAFTADRATAVEVHGRLVEDAPVAISLRAHGGGMLLPAGPAFQPDVDELREILDNAGALAASLPDDDTDERPAGATTPA
jgi:hypothetical protein